MISTNIIQNYWITHQSATPVAQAILDVISFDIVIYLAQPRMSADSCVNLMCDNK